MKKICLLFTLVLLVSNFQLINAQYENVEEFITFGKPIISPIEMDVQQKDNRLIFNAFNKSFFNYEFKIRFTQFENLSPRISEKQILLHPGTNVLFNLNVVDDSQQVQYNYSIQYVIGSKNYEPDLTFPYLVPVGNNKLVELTSLRENNEPRYQINHFKMNQNDTVFCIRKGLVTALPDNKNEVDRIVSSSLEVLHNDGTIAVYRGLDADLSKIKLGQTVYAGQPIGLVGYTQVLLLNLLNFEGGGKIQNLNIFFADDDRLISSEQIMNKRFINPITILKRELTKKEAKKFESNTLF
jgi:murein DD-endopeptidase MepM/ murein hydrolase activator NlpD